MNMAARLEIPGESPVIERIVIENISLHGACIVANRYCQVRDRVIVCDLDGAFRLDARVVYCRPLVDGRCIIGLHFNDAVILPAPDKRYGDGASAQV